MYTKITKTELELLTDVDMIRDYKNAIQVNRAIIKKFKEIKIAICHYGEANNKFMHDDDETKGNT